MIVVDPDTGRGPSLATMGRMRAFLALVAIVSGCVVEDLDDPELAETTSELGAGWCDDAPVSILNLPFENGVPINVEEPFVRVWGGLVILYFSDRAANDERDLHFALWTTSGFFYMGRVAGVNSATGIEGAPSIDPHGNFYFTNSALPGQIAHGTFSGWGAVTNVTPVTGIPPASLSNGVQFANMDIGVSPTETFAVLSRGAWIVPTNGQPVSGLPAAADLWYLRRLSAGSMIHLPDDTGSYFRALNTPDKLEYAPELSADGLRIYYTQTTLAPVTSSIRTASRLYNFLPFDPPTTVVGPIAAATSPADPNAVLLIEGPTVTPAGDRIFYHRTYVNAPSKLFTVARCGG